MIKFNDIKPTPQNQNFKFREKYPRLYRYIKDSILRKKTELPKILEINLWNWDSKNSQSSGLSWRYNVNSGIKQDFKINLNLRQILYVYKKPGYYLEKGRFYPGQVKGIRKYILFVIYHEIGHYQLKQKLEFDSTEKNPEKREIFADSWAFDTLTQGQKDFDFDIKCPGNHNTIIKPEDLLSSPARVKGIDKDLSDYRARGKESRAVLCFTGENKKIKIYHYSNQDFKGYIKPDFLGFNHYSKESLRESSLARAFFYIGKGKEGFLSGARYVYIAEIESSKIYDIILDKRNFKRWCINFNDLLIKIKNNGYFGISGNNGFKVVCLFKKIKYIDKRAC